MSVTPVGELHGHLRDWRYRDLPPAARRVLRERKLRAVIREAADYVPLYRERFRAAGLPPADIASLGDLDRLPILRRADFAAATADDRLSERAARGELHTETSSGSTGEPLTVHLDRRARRSRNLRFLRALRGAGYRPGQRVLLVTDRPGPAWRRRLGWMACLPDASPERLARAFMEARPHILYGCATPLRLLAERLLDHRSAIGRRGPGPRAVLTTAEMLDPATRHRLTEAFGCSVFDFYGLSEVGLVAAETPRGAGYRIAEEGVWVELLPSTDAPGLARVVVTDLDALAMPFIRYDTGDLAVLDETGGIVRIEGRSVDCLRLTDGRRISPYAVTRALERVPGLRRYSVVQTRPDTVRVRADVGDAAPDGVGHRVDAALRSILPGIKIRFEVDGGGSAAPSAWPRVVESRVSSLRVSTLESASPRYREPIPRDS